MKIPELEAWQEWLDDDIYGSNLAPTRREMAETGLRGMKCAHSDSREESALSIYFSSLHAFS